MCGCLLSVHYSRPEPFRILSGNVPCYVENEFVLAHTDFCYAGDWTDSSGVVRSGTNNGGVSTCVLPIHFPSCGLPFCALPSRSPSFVLPIHSSCVLPIHFPLCVAHPFSFLCVDNPFFLCVANPFSFLCVAISVMIVDTDIAVIYYRLLYDHILALTVGFSRVDLLMESLFSFIRLDQSGLV